MTLNSHFALNTVFRVKSFSMDALVLRHDCFKMGEDAYIGPTVSSKDVAHGLWFLAIYNTCKSYANIHRGSLVR